MPEDLGTAFLGECFGLFVDYINENHSNDYPDSYNHMAIIIENHTDVDWYLAQWTVDDGMERPFRSGASGRAPPLPAKEVPKGKGTACYVTTTIIDPAGPMGFTLWFKAKGTDKQVIYMVWKVPRLHDTFWAHWRNEYRTDCDDYNVRYEDADMDGSTNTVKAKVIVSNSMTPSPARSLAI